MAVVDQGKLKSVIMSKYQKARDSVILLEKAHKFAAVSDRIPEYHADRMEFGTFQQDTFTALFADMRGSTNRAVNIGPAKTFLTLHAVMPALIYVVEAYGGYVIDLPGDGIMALFKDNRHGITRNGATMNTETMAYRCGIVLIESIQKTVNPILESDDIPAVTFGVGIDSGTVVVTKTGTDRTFDTKAIGDPINNAAKKSDGYNEVKISKRAFHKVFSEAIGDGIKRDPKYTEWYVKSV